MKHIKKINESRIKEIKDLDDLRTGKWIDKEIKGLLYIGLNHMFNEKVNLLIKELKSGKKISDMCSDSKIILDEIVDYMKKEHPKQNLGNFKSIPSKVKEMSGEDIEFDRSILIEYLELSKGSVWYLSAASKFPCQRLKE